MINNKPDVIDVLRRRVSAGYRPSRDAQSAEDHDTDWLILSELEFQQIVLSARPKKSAGAGSKRDAMRRVS